jgi:hypothetical protein
LIAVTTALSVVPQKIRSRFMTVKRCSAKVVVLLALMQVLAACDRPPAGPSKVPDGSDGAANVPGVPGGPKTDPPTRGFVGDPVFRAIPGARIEVLDGPDAGKWTTTDATGSFGLTVSVDQHTRFRATKAGYLDGTTTLALHPDAPAGYVWMVLAPVAPPVNVAGDYTLTFIANSACATIPSELRTRTYAATIAPSNDDPRIPAGTSFWANIHGVVAVPGRERLPVGVAGNVVAVLLGEDGWPYFAEQLSPTTYYAPDGLVVFEGAASPVDPLAADFYGWIAYGSGSVINSPAALAVCGPMNHRLVMARQ